MGTSVKDIRSKNQGSGNSCVLDAFSVDPASGDAIFAVTASFSSTTHSAPTDSMGSTYTQIGTLTDYSGLTGGFKVSFWYTENVSGGTGVQVTLHVENPFGFMGGVAWLLTGVPASAYNGDGQITTGAATSTPMSATSSPAPSGGTFFIGAIAGIRNTSDPAFTDGAGWNTTGSYGVDSGMVTRARTASNSIYVATEYYVDAAAAQAVWGANATNLTFAASIASFGTEEIFAPGRGQLTLTGHAPAATIPQSVAPGTGALTLSGRIPTLSVPQNIAPATGALVFTGRAPSLSVPVGISVGVETLVMTGYAPTATLTIGTTTIAVGAGALVLTGRAPTVTLVTLGVDIPEVIGPTGSTVHVFSDMHMQCPATYYGGYKDGRIERAGYGELTLSDLVTGDPVSSTFSYRVSDYDLLLRRALASQTNRYWVDPVTVHMTTRANRAILGQAYPVFVGPIIDAQPSRPLSWDITLGDLVSQRVLTDRAVHPSRMIGDGFLHSELAAISTVIDPHTPEPIIYGEHRRVRDVDEASQHGFEVDLTDHYLGIWDIGGGEKHVWLGSGHACFDVPDVNTVAHDGTRQTRIPEEGSTCWIPHYAGWLGIFGAPYVDLHSSSFGNLRRYTLILGLVGDTNWDRVAWTSGGYPMDPAPDPMRLYAFIDGVETNGDGTGTLIVEFGQVYKHWMKNYGLRSAADSYQAGAWLEAPTWDLFVDGESSMLDDDSFDAVTAINQIRFPDLDGYPCAVIIGAKAGEIHPATKWISDFNRSGFVCNGWTNKGAFRIATLHPTEAVKASSRRITDAYEMREGSFNTEVKWDQQATRIHFLADPDYPTGRWMTSAKVDAGDAISNYDRVIDGAVREFPAAPGIAMSTHLAFLHSWVFKHPPRHVLFEDTIGPDASGDSLGYLKVGEYVVYQHYAQVGEPGQERLAWVLRRQIDAGRRRVLVKAWDVEDLIGFDIPDVVVETVNDTCETAIVVTNPADVPYAVNLDTTAHATDTDVAGIAGLPGPAVGYHAAEWKYTPASDGTLFLTTVHSLYDTQIAVCTGECGALALLEYNDNDGALTTSILEFAVTGAVPLTIIVYGYGPDDGGALTFGLLFTAA